MSFVVVLPSVVTCWRVGVLHHVFSTVIFTTSLVTVQDRSTQVPAIKFSVFQFPILAPSTRYSVSVCANNHLSNFFSIFSWNFSIHLIAEISSRLFHSRLSNLSFICFGVSGLPSFQSIPSIPLAQFLPSLPSIPFIPDSHLGHVSPFKPCIHCSP